MSALLSVVVPVYKVELYLNKCVDSVLSQTYTEFELILVDDGSPDLCGEMCDEYAKKDDRIKVIHKPNGGLSDARNAGIELAKGEYITFIDSDDWVDITYLEKLYNLMIETGSDISVCNFIRTENEDVTIDSENIEISEYTSPEILRYMFGTFGVQLTVAWGKLYRTELFEEIRYPVGKVHEDEATTYKLLYKAGKTVVSNEKLLYYRQRGGSIMRSGFKLKNKFDAIKAFEERAEFFKKIGLSDEVYKTYSVLFSIYNDILKHKNDFDYSKYKKKVKTELRGVIRKMRSGNYSLKYKILYELSNIMPNFSCFLYNTYTVSKKQRNKKD